MSVQCACRTLCFHVPAPVQMPSRLGFADKKCSFFTVKNFTEQMFQVHKNWEMGHFSDPGDGPWPSRTKQGPQTAHFIFLVGQIRGVFSFRGYPRHGPFSRLATPIDSYIYGLCAVRPETTLEAQKLFILKLNCISK